MESQCGPPRMTWYGAPRRTSSSDPSMRVSDAERAEMADTLSKHYADGRLDDAEFKVRLDRAMGAKTRADLNGLLTDLPPVHAEETTRRPGIVRRTGWALTVFAIVVLTIGTAVSFATFHVPWFLVFVVLFIVWRSGRFNHHHHHDRSAARY